MPEELAKAAGMEFSPPPSRLESLGWKFGLRSRAAAGGKSEAMFGGGKGELAAFLDVLKARCDVWEMEGGKDYRRRDAEGGDTSAPAETEATHGFEGLENLAPGNVGLGYEQSVRTTASSEDFDPKPASIPKNYHINTDSTPHSDIWSQLLTASSPEISTLR